MMYQNLFINCEMVQKILIEGETSMAYMGSLCTTYVIFL